MIRRGWKRRIRLGNGLRFLSAADQTFPFKTGDPRMDRFSLKDYWKWHGRVHATALVLEFEDRLSAIALVYHRGDCLFIEKLARDRHAKPGTGALLLRLIEGQVARPLGLPKIRLDALGAPLKEYYERLGFVQAGDPVVDPDEPEWGLLIPMEKSVGPSSFRP